MWLVYSAVSAFFAGLIPVLGKKALAEASAEFISFARNGCALIFALIVLLTSGDRPIPHFPSLLFFGLAGICELAAWLFTFRLIDRCRLSVIAPLDKATIATVFFLSYMSGIARVTPRQLVSSVVIVVGVFFILFFADSFCRDTETIVFLIAAHLFSALSPIFSRAGLMQNRMSAYSGLFVRNLSGFIFAVLLLVFSIRKNTVFHSLWKCRENKNCNKQWISAKTVFFSMASGLSGAVSWMFYYLALNGGAVGTVQAVAKLGFLVTLFFSRVIYKEKIGKRIIIGYAVIFFGVLILLF